MSTPCATTAMNVSFQSPRHTLHSRIASGPSVGHTWTPSCTRAALDIGWCTFQEAIKMYAAFYTFNQVVSRRTDIKTTANSVRSILQSSVFLAFNAYIVIFIFCMSRRLLGKFYYLFAAHIPATIGSYLAIQVERQSRRSALSFYVANVAGETVFNKIMQKGWFPAIPNGEVALFAVSTASLLYLIHRDGFGKDPVSLAFKFLLGKEFVGQKCKEYSSDTKLSNENINDDERHSDETQTVSDETVERRRREPETPKKTGKAAYSCPHMPDPVTSGDCAVVSEGSPTGNQIFSLLKTPSMQTFSCSLHALHAFTRNFLIAFTGQTLVSACMRPRLLIQDPVRVFLEGLWKENRSLKTGLFVAGFASLFKATGCLIRSVCRVNPESGNQFFGDEKRITFVSALIASCSMFFNPSPTAAQYMMWKLVETLYFEAASKGKVKYVDLTVDMLYALSTAQLFYVAVMEPKLMRKSYTKWLNIMTRNSFGLLNRNIIDVFGTESSFGYTVPDFDFDVKHCSDKFKESVLIWMI